MRKFQLTRDYYEEKVYLYKKKTITINPGVTVLVGCNGIGKSTLLHQIEYRLKKEEVGYIKFDNLSDGGSNARSKAGFYGNFEFLGTSLCSSEGENIVMNLGQIAMQIGNYVRKNPDNKELWILLDAIDSGLSVDNVVDVKELLFKTILEDPSNKDREIYILVSANEYEMVRSENCFDVYAGKYIKFQDYEEYRNFILESKKIKEERYSN